MIRARIAVVDDSEQMRDLLAELLGMSGFEVTTLNGGEASVDALLEAVPDAIVLDLVLTGSGDKLSGWDFLRLVRSHPRLNRVPVLVCSGDLRAIKERESDLREDVLVNVLPKPFGVDDVYDSLARLLDASQAPAWDDEQDLVLIADEHSQLVDASAAILRRLGLSKDELRRRSVADIVAHEHEWTVREWERYLHDREWSGSVVLRGADGHLPARAKAEIIEASGQIWHLSRVTLDNGAAHRDSRSDELTTASRHVAP